MPQIILRQMNMKKTYLAPDMELVMVTARTGILAISNGENLRMVTYGQRGEEEDDIDDFWN